MLVKLCNNRGQLSLQTISVYVSPSAQTCSVDYPAFPVLVNESLCEREGVLLLEMYLNQTCHAFLACLVHPCKKLRN